MASYLSHLQDLGVAGVRLDAAKHIPKEDLANIFAMLSSLLWEKDSWPINSMRAEKPRNFRVLKSWLWHKVGPRSVYVMLGRNMKSRYIRIILDIKGVLASCLSYSIDFINCIRSPTMIGLMLLDVARCGWGKWRAEPHHSLNTWRPGFKVKFL